MTLFNLSIDPGTNHCGFCVWRSGKVWRSGCWNTPKHFSYEEKVLWLKQRFVDLMVELLLQLQDEGEPITVTRPLRQCAVEEFPTRHSKDDDPEIGTGANKHSMMKCAGVQMSVFVISADWSEEAPVRASKSTTTKQESVWLARTVGVTTKNADEADAIAIGLAAGFDKKER